MPRLSLERLIGLGAAGRPAPSRRWRSPGEEKGSAPGIGGRRTPLLAGIAVGLLAAAVYALTLPDYGLVSDEGNYFESSRRLFGWMEYFARSWGEGDPGRAFARPVLEESWRWGGDRIPHPPFSREVAGLSGFLFYGRMDPLVAYRLLGVLVAGTLAGGVAAWGTRRAGLPAGLFAGAAFVLMPRLFAHAHFAGTDLVLSALLFFSLFCAAEARRAPLAWAGLLWGLALATKFSAVLLPLALVPWLALFRRDRLSQLPALLLAALAAFVAVDPALWADPLAGLHEYLRQGLGRRAIEMAQLPTFYLGRLYTFRPPWHYPLVMLLLTTPMGLLLLAAWGGAAGTRQERLRPVVGLALLVTAVFLGALALPRAPLHDDIRLFLPVFPFLALLAGFGAALITRRPRMRLVGSVVAALALAGSASATVRLHPLQASYFNALAGGIEGAQRRGLEVTGMKEVLNRDVYADLNRLLPRDASLEGGPFLYEDLLFAQRFGWLRPDVDVRHGPPAEYVLIVNRRGWFRASDLALFDFSEALYRVRLAGVPLLSLYRLR